MTGASQMARPTCNDRSQVDRMVWAAVVKQSLTTAPVPVQPTVKQDLTVGCTAKSKAARQGKGDRA